MLEFNADAWQLVCVDLSSHNFSRRVDQFARQIQQPVGTAGCRPRMGTDALQLVYAGRQTDRRCKPAAAGHWHWYARPINPQNGVVRQAVNLGWYNLPLKHQLENRFEIPVHIINDSHIAGLAEYTLAKCVPAPTIVIKIRPGHRCGHCP